MPTSFTQNDAARADEILSLRKRLFLTERRTQADIAEFASIEAKARAAIVSIYGDDTFPAGDEWDAMQAIYFAADVVTRAA